MKLRDNLLLGFLVVLGLFLARNADAREFNYDEATHTCINKDGKRGMNRMYLGECGTFYRSRLQNQEMSGFKMPGVNLKQSKLGWADLRGADLRGANLSKTESVHVFMSYTDLRYANLSKADFSEAFFNGADLRGADFSNTKLAMTRFQGADLRGVNFEGADLQYAYFDEKTKLPFSPEEAIMMGMLWTGDPALKPNPDPKPVGSVESLVIGHPEMTNEPEADRGAETELETTPQVELRDEAEPNDAQPKVEIDLFI